MSIQPLASHLRTALRDLIVAHQDYHRALEPHWPAGADIAGDYLSYLESECAEYAGQIFVAIDEGLAGFICVVTGKRGAPDDPAPYAFVFDLFVAPEYRRRGIAIALMAAAEDFARERGIIDLRLAVLERNREAQAFYERLGFRGYARVLRKELDPQA
jgi:ribosomal protein S18 acetylase RimI-like enzyme